MEMVRTEVLERLAGGLVVSCQAWAPSPLRSTEVMATFAAAAERAGARGIRAEGAEDVRAIRQRVSLPVIGLRKRHYDTSPVYITPTFAEAREIAAAGADIIAVDGTPRPRPGDESLAGLIERIHTELGRPVLADVGSLASCQAAWQAGADAISTTLAGYTEESARPESDRPDLDLVRALAEWRNALPASSGRSRPFLLAEGRYHTPEDAAAAIRLGADAVVVGTALTNLEWATERFVTAIAGAASDAARASSDGDDHSAIDDYFYNIRSLLETAWKSTGPALARVAARMAQLIVKGHQVHLLDHGHLLAQEFAFRAGGLALLHTVSRQEIDSPVVVRRGDAVVIASVSGKSAEVVEAALTLRRRGVLVVALSSLAQSRAVTPEHTSGRLLYEVADEVIDLPAPAGDAILVLPGLPARLAPASGVLGAMVMWALSAQIASNLLQLGIEPTVYESVNLPGGQEKFDQAVERYRSLGY